LLTAYRSDPTVYFTFVSRILATDKPWASATSLYIARAIERITCGSELSILDMGCGQGRMMSLLMDYGHLLHGFDLPDKAEALAAHLRPLFGNRFDDQVRVMEDERRIPFESSRFDVVYANQVFEHVRFLDQMFEECTRVLKPEGTLITLFPLATYPLEGHVLVPCAHWIPPGALRRAYLRAFLTMRIGRRLPSMSIGESAREWDERLRLFTFYRFMNELEALFTYYFEEWMIDTGTYIDAKIDMLQESPSRLGRAAGRVLNSANGPWLANLITYGFNAVFVARRPIPARRRHPVVEWRH
jgi:SAM-dependent methyltransferase